MKKTIKLLSVVLAGLALASCAKEELTVLHSDQIKSGQLEAIESSYVLLADNASETFATFKFDKSEYGIGAAVQYAVYGDISESFENEVKLGSASTADAGIAVTVKAVNTMLVGLGCEPETEVTAYFRLKSNMMGEKNIIDGTEVISNVISAKVTPYNSEILDCDQYPVAYLPGGYQAKGDGKAGWVFTDEQYLYDYAKNGVYSGLIDVYESGAAGKDYGFKLTLSPEWGDDEYGDNPDAAAASESDNVTLNIKAQGNGNIMCFDTYRFYMFSFNKESQVLSKLYAFDNVGIVGAFNEWNAADASAKMSYNKYYHRFYIDWTFDEATELKFTCNDAWDLNWGKDVVKGGDNIAVAAGSYRIYLNLNNGGSIDFNTKMYGQEEPGAKPAEPEPDPDPDPDPETGASWGLIGVGGDWDNDINMTEVLPGIWMSPKTNLSGSWKVRFDHGWDYNFGGTTPTQVGQFVQAVHNGDNIALEGEYAVVYNANAGVISTLGWGVTGSIASAGINWDGDVPMTLGADGKWYSVPFALTTTDEIKLRQFGGWDANRGGACTAVGEAFAVTNNGDNFKAPEDGTYMVVYDPTAETVTLSKEYWGFIGEFNSWGGDEFLVPGGDGKWYGFNRTYQNGWKIRQAAGWDVNRGGAYTWYDPFDVTNGGDNITVEEGVATAGFNVIYDSVAETITINQEILF